LLQELDTAFMIFKLIKMQKTSSTEM